MIYLAIYPFVETFFLAESTLRLWRAGFPFKVAYTYSLNR
jgi:hypothetical protein